MSKLEKSYWFYIDTYTHISIKDQSLILYNPFLGKALEYSHAPKPIKIIKRLRSKNNLMVVRLKKSELEDLSVSRFVEEIRNNFMGDLIDTSCSTGKPIQVMPIVKILKDVKHLKKNIQQSIEKNIMKLLSEISLYITNICDQGCEICSHTYKQFLCCTKGKNRCSELDILKIKTLFEQIKYSSLTCVNIIGGDILGYSQLEELLTILKNHLFLSIFYCHYLNIIKHKGRLNWLDFDKSFLKILISFPCNRKELKLALESLNKVYSKCQFIFIIQDEQEFNRALDIISSLSIQNFLFQPWCNGENQNFFEDNIFLKKKDILEAKPRLKDIYARGVINTINFGRLTILNNGHIYANVNAPKLGSLGKESIYDVIYKEIYYGKSWRRTRKRVEPCKRCTFDVLCPPISNYEYAIGRNNLCHIKHKSCI